MKTHFCCERNQSFYLKLFQKKNDVNTNNEEINKFIENILNLIDIHKR